MPILTKAMTFLLNHPPVHPSGEDGRVIKTFDFNTETISQILFQTNMQYIKHGFPYIATHLHVRALLCNYEITKLHELLLPLNQLGVDGWVNETFDFCMAVSVSKKLLFVARHFHINQLLMMLVGVTYETVTEISQVTTVVNGNNAKCLSTVGPIYLCVL